MALENTAYINWPRQFVVCLYTAQLCMCLGRPTLRNGSTTSAFNLYGCRMYPSENRNRHRYCIVAMAVYQPDKRNPVSPSHPISCTGMDKV